MTTLLRGKELKRGMVFSHGDTDPKWWEVLGELDHGYITAKPQGAETTTQTVCKLRVGGNGLYPVKDDTWDLK